MTRVKHDCHRGAPGEEVAPPAGRMSHANNRFITAFPQSCSSLRKAAGLFSPCSFAALAFRAGLLADFCLSGVSVLAFVFFRVRVRPARESPVPPPQQPRPRKHAKARGVLPTRPVHAPRGPPRAKQVRPAPFFLSQSERKLKQKHAQKHICAISRSRATKSFSSFAR